MVVPSTKRKSHGAPHQRLTLDETKRSRVPLDSVVGLLRPKFGTRLWSAGTCPRLESGDMSPHSKASEASAAKPPRPDCVTRHNFMFFCLSCPLVRCSLPTRWIQNFCVGWRNCFRGREATQKLPRQRTRGTISCACSERWSFRFCPCRDRSSVASRDLCHLASTLPRCCASPLVSSFPLLVPGKNVTPFGTFPVTDLKAAGAAQPARPSHSAGLLAARYRRALRQFDDSKADQFRSRRALW